MNKPEMFKRFCEDLWTHVLHAKSKHPNRYVLPEQNKAEDIDHQAKWYKSFVDEAKPEFQYVLRSEFCEFLAEAVRDNRERAREESLDLCAVLYRYEEQQGTSWIARDDDKARVGIDLPYGVFWQLDHRATDRGMTLQEYVESLIKKGIEEEMKEETK